MLFTAFNMTTALYLQLVQPIVFYHTFSATDPVLGLFHGV